MGQKQEQKAKPVSKKQSSEVVAETQTTDDKAALKNELDALLDEIDEVLEENASDFVRDYLQKGGE